MKKLLSVLMFSTLSLCLSAQVVTLRFIGKSAENKPLRLDSVLIENTTRSWSEKLVYPDSILTLKTVGIEENQAKGLSLECYPNPFNGTTMVGLNLDNNEKVLLQLYSLSGQKVAEYSQSLSAGLHAFEVSVAAPQVYLLTATTSTGRTTIKMVSQSAAGSNQITSQGLMQLGIAKKASEQYFKAGDRMSYVGYTTYKGQVYPSLKVAQKQNDSQDIMLMFGLDLPMVTTDEVTDITNTEADVSVTVSEYIGENVNSRGVCWSLSPNPTTKDFHMSSGSGTGSFVCTINSLAVGTKYYVRGYATTKEGTEYGNELSFTTTNIPFACGTDKARDFDKNLYATVKIGNQCWLKDNLRSEHFASGRQIELSSKESSYPTSAYRYYPGGNEMNLSAYGYLYNWPAVMNGASSSNTNPSHVQGICPNGWHVPSQAELQYMLDYVKSNEEYWCNDNSDNIAKVLCDVRTWNGNFVDSCAVGFSIFDNNATGFSLRAAGGIYSQYNHTMGMQNHLWTTTVSETGSNYAYALYMYYSSSEANIYTKSKTNGASVRCVYDELVGDSLQFLCGQTETKDYDNNEYGSIRLGKQCWMKENVRSEHYADGTPIAKGTEMSTEKAYRYETQGDLKQFGYLYNWKAAMNGATGSNVNPSGVQGVCPNGWHMPSDAEWEQLTAYIAKQDKYVRPEDTVNIAIAKALASTTDWKEVMDKEQPWIIGMDIPSNNASGFTAMPAGSYTQNAATELGIDTYFWTTTDNGNNANYFGLRYDASFVQQGSEKKDVGFSVRCVR